MNNILIYLIIDIHFFIDCLHEWGIVQKVVTMMLDNASIQPAIEKFQTMLKQYLQLLLFPSCCQFFLIIDKGHLDLTFSTNIVNDDDIR